MIRHLNVKIYEPNMEWWAGMPTIPTRLELIDCALDDHNRQPGMLIHELPGSKKTLKLWDSFTLAEIGHRWIEVPDA
jgi:hypothetical protein